MSVGFSANVDIKELRLQIYPTSSSANQHMDGIRSSENSERFPLLGASNLLLRLSPAVTG